MTANGRSSVPAASRAARSRSSIGISIDSEKLTPTHPSAAAARRNAASEMPPTSTGTGRAGTGAMRTSRKRWCAVAAVTGAPDNN